ncbi:hypothetical protein LLH03_18115 [bacterium]|nr:hypothetical protein [bacterium]
MWRRVGAFVAATALLTAVSLLTLRPAQTDVGPGYRSPFLLALSPDKTTVYVSDCTADQVVALDAASGKRTGSCQVDAPTGMAASPDGRTLYVASGDRDQVTEVALPAMTPGRSTPVGRHPVGLTLSPDGTRIYCCNQFSDDVSVLETSSLRVLARLRAVREPRFAALSPAANTLLVANHLPLGSNLDDDLGAEVSLINLANGAHARLKLARGATDVGQICCSADGRFAYVPHVLARWLLPPTQLDRGWMATNALTVIDVPNKRVLGTVLLDDLDHGAANGFGAALSESGDKLCVTQSGTNEVQLLDTARLLKLITEWPPKSQVALEDDLTAVYRAGVRTRVNCGGLCPRGVVCAGREVFVANYYSGTVSRLGLDTGKVLATVPLGEQPPMDPVRRGEMLFHDATNCFQGWQSCETCHPEGRGDGLAWDLPNDGIGNPKNAKSLLLSSKTPPSMAHGVRASMRVAVVAGFKYILFHPPTDEEVDSVCAYLDSMKPERSPFLKADGSLSEAAKRGKALFESPEVGCARCHPAPLYTDLQMYEVGTRGKFDQRADFDTPTLVEMFRTAPFLHDGSAVTMREVLKDFNKTDQHGHTSQLTDRQLKDLAEYALSL